MKQKKLVGILLVACLLSLLPMHVVAVGVFWFEDFKDGNYDGWIVTGGTFDASARYLEATELGVNTIYNKSEVACGIWLWDLREDPVQEVDWHIFFIAIGNYISNISALNISGYSISAEYGITSNLTLYRWDEGASTVLDRDTIPTDEVKWVNYNISRDSLGHFQVVRISEVLLWETDTTYSYSQNFLIHCEHDCAIDNITIISCGYTQPETTTTTTSTTTTTTTTTGTIEVPDWIQRLVVVGVLGIVGVVVVTTVWLWRRRH